MKCPRDGKVLVFTDDGRHQRNKCPECRGVLLGADEVDGALGRGAGKAPAAMGAERIGALPESTVSCPRDGAVMHKLEHHGIELDLCPECRALWLDPGELDKLGALGKRAKRAATGAVAAAGGVAVAAASQQNQASLAGEIARTGGEIVAEGAIEIALELVGDAIGSVLSGLF